MESTSFMIEEIKKLQIKFIPYANYEKIIDTNIYDLLMREGFITYSNGKFVFIDDIYAIRFIARRFLEILSGAWKNINLDLFYDFFFNKVLVNSEFQEMRLFLNGFLKSERINFPQLLIAINNEKYKKFLKNKYDSQSHWILHQIREKNIEIFALLWESLNSFEKRNDEIDKEIIRCSVGCKEAFIEAKKIYTRKTPAFNEIIFKAETFFNKFDENLIDEIKEKLGLVPGTNPVAIQLNYRKTLLKSIAEKFSDILKVEHEISESFLTFFENFIKIFSLKNISNRKLVQSYISDAKLYDNQKYINFLKQKVSEAEEIDKLKDSRQNQINDRKYLGSLKKTALVKNSLNLKSADDLSKKTSEMSISDGELDLSQKASEMSISDGGLNESGEESIESDGDIIMKESIESLNRSETVLKKNSSIISVQKRGPTVDQNSCVLFNGLTYQNLTISSDGVFGDVVFQNDFLASFDGELVKFYNLCPFNAVFSAFHSLYNFTSFKKTISEFATDFEFFRFIIDINKSFIDKKIEYKNNRYVIECKENNTKLIEFIDKMLPQAIQIIRTEIDGTRIKALFTPKCGMDFESNNVFEQNDAQTGFFRNWPNIASKSIFTTKIYSFKCPKCNRDSAESEHFMLKKVFSDNEIKEIDQTILSRSQCSQCGVEVNGNSEIIFPDQCLIIDVSIMSADGKEVAIKLNEISPSIILNNRQYNLKVVIDHPGYHFSSYHRFDNGNFLFMNDNQKNFGEELLYTDPSSIEVRPVILIYLKDDKGLKLPEQIETHKTIDSYGETPIHKVNRNVQRISDPMEVVEIQYINEDANLKIAYKKDIKCKSGEQSAVRIERKIFDPNTIRSIHGSKGIYGDVMFKNSFEINYNDELVHFKDVCRFNSLFSAFHSLCNFTHLRDILLNLELPFFKFMKEIDKEFNIENPIVATNELHQKLIGFIDQEYPELIKNNKIEKEGKISIKLGGEIFPIIEGKDEEGGIFKNWNKMDDKMKFCIKREEFKCKCGYVFDEEEWLLPHVDYSLSESDGYKILRQIDNFFECSQCKNDLSTAFEFILPKEFFMLRPLLLEENTENYKELSEIPKEIIFDDIHYDLKAVINKTGFHFNSFFRVNETDFLLMDDCKIEELGERIGEEIFCKNGKLSDETKIFAMILIYVRRCNTPIEYDKRNLTILASVHENIIQTDEFVDYLSEDDADFNYEEDLSEQEII